MNIIGRNTSHRAPALGGQFMRKTYQLAIALICSLGLLAPSLASAQETSGASGQELRVAYVDLQRALGEIEDGQELRQRLERELQRRQEQFNEKQQEVQQFQEEMESGFEMLNPEAQREKLEEYQTKLSELQQLYQQYQQELSRQEMEGTSQIFDRMVEIIKTISEERGYTLVLEKTQSSLLYADTSMDFTEEVIERYDNQY
jgi:outer membrane protein